MATPQPRFSRHLPEIPLSSVLWFPAPTMFTLYTDGHWFRTELWSKNSPPTSTIQLGISERYDLVLPKAGGSQALPGDYRYYNGRSFKLREGSWGIIRVHDIAAGAPLRRLPGRK